jgi:hypothetical protein
LRRCSHHAGESERLVGTSRLARRRRRRPGLDDVVQRAGKGTDARRLLLVADQFEALRCARTSTAGVLWNCCCATRPSSAPLGLALALRADFLGGRSACDPSPTPYKTPAWCSNPTRRNHARDRQPGRTPERDVRSACRRILDDVDYAPATCRCSVALTLLWNIRATGA